MNLSHAILIAWMQTVGAHYNIEPEFIQAVAVVESQSKINPGEFRCGALGRKGTYYGPMGIHKCFLSRWSIDDPFINIERGAQALSWSKDKQKVLKRYNAAFNENYYKAVMGYYNHLRNQNGR